MPHGRARRFPKMGERPRLGLTGRGSPIRTWHLKGATVRKVRYLPSWGIERLKKRVGDIC